MNTQINSLAELQAEKKKLKIQMEVSKQEFFQSFRYTKTQAKDFLIKKVALPAGALSIVTIGINKMVASNHSSAQKVAGKKDNSFFLKVMPIVLPMIRAYLSTNGKDFNLSDFIEDMITPKKKESEINV